MQVPRTGVAVLAVDPIGLAMGIRRNVVVARDLVAVPPARLDALRTCEEVERALERGLAVCREEALRPREEPDGAEPRWRDGRRLRSAEVRGPPVFLGTMVVRERDPEDA